MAPPPTSRPPEPPQGSFASDNAAAVCPEVLEALVAANTAAAPAYGEDPWTARLGERFGELLDRPVEILPCWGGTGANVVGLASVLQPWQAVLCAQGAHVMVDECGAPVRLTGSPVVALPDVDGKISPDALGAYDGWAGSVHHSQPGVVSVSQATEAGTAYSVDELGELCDAARSRGMLVHLDGARIANAVCDSPADLSAMVADTGVDLMTFGATKNGAMYGEVVVYLRPELARHAAFHQKQAGQLPSKARFVSAQVLALLEDDLWLRNAAHANAMARRLADAVREVPGLHLEREPDANSLFVRLPPDAIRPLQSWSPFWEWDLSLDMVRWMTAWSTTEADVERFAAGVRHFLTGRSSSS